MCNSHRAANGKHFNPIECTVLHSTTENLDQYRKPFYANRNAYEDSINFLLSTGSSMIDEYQSTSKKITGKSSWGADLLPKTE